MRTSDSCVIIVLALSSFIELSSGISCYVCDSINRSQKACDDPMTSAVRHQTNCRQGVPGREGLFYAKFCTKIKGVRKSGGLANKSITLRGCSIDKLADIPTHCGTFKVGDETYRGCLATCSTDWCNAASTTTIVATLWPTVMMLFATYALLL